MRTLPRWALPPPSATPGLGRGVPLGAGTLQTLLSGLCLGQQLSLAGVPLSPLYHANFSRDNFLTMSPPARTETLYGAGPREAAALPRQTKAHCCRRTCLRLSGRRAPPPARAEATPGPPPPGARSSYQSPGRGAGLGAPRAGSRAAGLLGRERGGLGRKSSPKPKHLIRLISSHTNVLREEGFWAPKLFCD